MPDRNHREVRISDTVTLLKPERPEPAIVVLVVRDGRLTIAMRFARAYVSPLRADDTQGEMTW